MQVDSGRSSVDTIFWIDVLRFFSVFAVVVLQVSGEIVIVIRDISTPNRWIGNAIDSDVRWAVSVFVKISGALLLDPFKDDSLDTGTRLG
jgi:surface polysaccharide O-acyltransferase-like enzyme